MQLLPQGLPAGLSFPEGPAGKQRVTPASAVPTLGSTVSKFGGVRNGGSRSRRKLPVLKHISLFIFFLSLFFLRERSLQGPFPD